MIKSSIYKPHELIFFLEDHTCNECEGHGGWDGGSEHVNIAGDVKEVTHPASVCKECEGSGIYEFGYGNL